jgi:DNA repair ATPase RecN
MQRITQVQAAARALGNAPEAAEALERARMAEGAMTWRLAHDYPARVWEARKALKAADAAMAEARQRDAALAQAQREEPARLKQFGERIVELEQRIKRLIPQVAALVIEQRGQVQEIAVAELMRQKARLAGYDTQARFAVAQMVDRAKAAADERSSDAQRK